MHGVLSQNLLVPTRVFFAGHPWCKGEVRLFKNVPLVLYLVHELSPTRGAVFLVEIYQPVALNTPKRPLFEKSDMSESHSFQTLTLFIQYDGCRLTPWILALVFLQVLVQSVNSGKFRSRAAYSLVPKRTQCLPGCSLPQYEPWVGLSPCPDSSSDRTLSTFFSGLKVPFSYHIDSSLKKI